MKVCPKECAGFVEGKLETLLSFITLSKRQLLLQMCKTTSVDDAERIKRQLPSTVTPERTLAKKFQQENNENLLKEAHNDSKSCRTLFSDSTEDPVIENHGGIETTPIALEQTETEEPLNQSDDFIKKLL